METVDDINKKKNKVFCGNCGELGHIYRNCRQPITSFGVILFRLKDNVDSDYINNLQLLMIQRKDSLSYVEFVRGKYNLNDIEKLKRILSNMTENERIFIRNNNFSSIWNRLWLGHDSSMFQNEFDQSSQKFNILSTTGTVTDGKCYNLNDLINSTNHIYDTPEWEIPKGRRNIKETDMECAIREFGEETGIYKDSYVILDEIQQYQELFV